MTILLGSTFALTACSSAATPDKMARIKPAMTAAHVEAILGQPARIEQSETTGLSGEVDYYPASNGEGRVIYLNNAVFKADFVSKS
jgi:hypothetical protein